MTKEEFLNVEAEKLSKKTEAQLKLRAELDDCVWDQAEREARRLQQEEAEARGRELFQQAKKVSHFA